MSFKRKMLKPSDLRAEAERLMRNGTMPSLDRLLDAVAETRVAFKPKIRVARKLKEVQ